MSENTRQYVLIGIIGAVLVLSVYQSFQIGKLKSTGNAQANGITGAVTGGPVDMAGWTDNEKMMYQHHGTLPQRLQGGARPKSGAGTGMVGGC